MRRTTRAGIFTAGLLCVALAAGARGQDEVDGVHDGRFASQIPRAYLEAAALPVEQAREAAWAFLSQGPGAPLPDLRRADLAHTRAKADLFLVRDGVCRIVVYHEHELWISNRGTVLFYSRSGATFCCRDFDEHGRRKSDEDIAREVRARTHFDEEALRARALAFASTRIPGFARRRFVTELHWPSSPGDLKVELHERPGPGLLAVYPDFAALDLNPETGEVSFYMASDVRAAVTTPPAVDEAAARAAAATARPGSPIESVELTMILKRGRPRAVWCVRLEMPADAPGWDGEGEPPYMLLFDAADGRPLSSDED
jgi:hypothetical protein